MEVDEAVANEEPVRSLITVELSLEEEFYLGVGVVLNNWYALEDKIDSLEAKMREEEIGARECRQTEPRKKQLVEGVFWTAFNSILSFKNLMCSWDDSVEYLGTTLAQDLDVVVEDGSTDNLMSDLLEMYHILQKHNHRSEMLSRFTFFNNNLHILTKEPLNYSLMSVIRKFPHSPPVPVYAVACSVQTINHVFLEKLCPEFVHHKHRLLMLRNNSDFAVYKSPDSSDSETEQNPTGRPSPRNDAGPTPDCDHCIQRAENAAGRNVANANDADEDWVTVSRRRDRN